MSSDLLHCGYILSLRIKSNGVDKYPHRQWGDKVWSQNRNRHHWTNGVKHLWSLLMEVERQGKKRCLSRVFQCLLTTALYTNLMLLTVLQVLLSNKTSMNSENTTVEEHSLIELYLLLSRSAGPSCPNFIVVHINPL